MNELIDLLERWAELEPERCSLHGKMIGGLHVLVGADHWAGIGQRDFNWKDYAAIQFAVQRSIVSHSLLFRLEHASNGIYYASAVEPNPGSYHPGQDKEPAIALLKAYLTWLEKWAEVAAGGEG